MLPRYKFHCLETKQNLKNLINFIFSFKTPSRQYKVKLKGVLEVVAQWWKWLVPFLCTRVQASLCTFVTPTVSYMLTELGGCSMGPGLVVVRVSWSGHPGLKKKLNWKAYVARCYTTIWQCCLNKIANFLREARRIGKHSFLVRHGWWELDPIQLGI